MGFHDRLAKAWATSGSMLCVGLDPDPAAFPDAARRRARRHRALLHGDRRRHRRPRVRVQAAVRPLRRRSAPSRQLEAVCRYIRETLPRRRARARRQARRRRLDRRALRPGGVRPLRRRRRDRQPVPRHRRRGAVPRRAAACSRCATRATPAAPRSRTSTSAARRCSSAWRRWSPTRWSRARRGRARRRRHVPGPARRGPGDRRRPADPACPASAPRAATSRRRCGRLDRPRHRPAAQLVARRSSTPRGGDDFAEAARAVARRDARRDQRGAAG